MVKFEPVKEEEVQDTSSKGRGSHGRISGSIIQMFMESGHYMARLDRTGIKLGAANLKSSLNSYAIGNRIPVEVTKVGNDVYLRRTDINKDGNPIAQEKDEVLKMTPKKVDELIQEGQN